MNIPSFSFAAGMLGLALAVSPNAATAQTTATTGPLGYYTFSAPQGTSMWVCGLVTKNDFAGAMTGTTPGAVTSTLQQTGAGWTPGAFSNHYVEIREGVWEGLILDIVSNSADAVVVEGNVGASPGFALAGNEKYAIRKHVTLGTMLPGGGGLTPFIDLVRVFRSDGSTGLFTFDNGNGYWVDANDFVTNSSGEIIYPGQGYVITTGAGATITIGGNEVSTVKTTVTKVPVYLGRINLVGLINPLVASNPNAVSVAAFEEHQMGDIGLLNNGFVDFVDTFRRFKTDGTLASDGLYIPNGNQLLDANDFVTVRNSDIIRVGAAFMISPQQGDEYYTQPVLH